MKQLLQILMGLIVLGCSPNKENPIDLLKIFEKKDQTFVINNQNDTVIIGQKGTKIRIPKEVVSKSISDKDSLKIVLNEYYSKSDMILAGLSTTSNGKILETKGMINLELYLNNEKITELNKSIEVQFAGTKDFNDYSVFYGDFMEHKMNWNLDTITKHYHIYYNEVLLGKPCECDYAYDTTRYDSIVWDKSFNKIDSILTFTASKDTLIYPDYWRTEAIDYNPKFKEAFVISKLGWINCDRFTDFPEVTNIEIKSNSSSNTYYYLVFDEINSILPNYVRNAFHNVPVGQKVTLIGIDYKDETLYFGMSDAFKIQKDMILELNLKEATTTEIKKMMRKIDK